jgi:hypothetical protein
MRNSRFPERVARYKSKFPYKKLNFKYQDETIRLMFNTGDPANLFREAFETVLRSNFPVVIFTQNSSSRSRAGDTWRICETVLLAPLMRQQSSGVWYYPRSDLSNDQELVLGNVIARYLKAGETFKRSIHPIFFTLMSTEDFLESPSILENYMLCLDVEYISLLKEQPLDEVKFRHPSSFHKGPLYITLENFEEDIRDIELLEAAHERYIKHVMSWTVGNHFISKIRGNF